MQQNVTACRIARSILHVTNVYVLNKFPRGHNLVSSDLKMSHTTYNIPVDTKVQFNTYYLEI